MVENKAVDRHQQRMEQLRKKFADEKFVEKINRAFIEGKKEPLSQPSEQEIRDHDIDYVIGLYYYGEEQAQEVKRLQTELARRDAIIQELAEKLNAITDFLNSKQAEVVAEPTPPVATAVAVAE